MTTAAHVRAAATAQQGALTAAMVAALRGPLARRHTLLAVCPNSEAVARAALLAAAEADAPLLYAATLNQVAPDGGYTGWTPATFTAFVAAETERLGLDVVVVPGLDHGGPWKADRHYAERWPLEKTWAAVLTALEACLDAGYGLLHLDPTVDPTAPQPVPISIIVDRTLALLRHAEDYRQQRGLPPVAYEVGTEEVGGGLASTARFAAFLHALDAALGAAQLPRPSFVVGDVGTVLDSSHFNAARARLLTKKAAAFGALLKGHYTDDVVNLDAYPLSGMGGANVGPGLAAVEYDALMDLVALARSLGAEPALPAALREAVLASGRWEKWRKPEEEGQAFGALAPERQAWLLRTGSRYIWTHPEVQAARQRLYAQVRAHRDAEAYVCWRIKQAILHYYHAFNLVGFNRRLLAAWEAAQGAA